MRRIRTGKEGRSEHKISELDELQFMDVIVTTANYYRCLSRTLSGHIKGRTNARSSFSADDEKRFAKRSERTVYFLDCAKTQVKLQVNLVNKNNFNMIQIRMCVILALFSVT